MPNYYVEPCDRIYKKKFHHVRTTKRLPKEYGIKRNKRYFAQQMSSSDGDYYSIKGILVPSRYFIKENSK